MPEEFHLKLLMIESIFPTWRGSWPDAVRICGCQPLS